MPILELRHVSKKYDSQYASRSISFSVGQGEFVTLLGPSGCGKTTLLKMIGGFQQPTEGEILIRNEVVNQVPPEKRQTAMCFQSYALFPHLSVSHNICFGMRQQGVDKKTQQQRLREILEQVGLMAHKDKLPSALSGGQQQRVALARAMVTRPEILLFDEPLSNLDAALRETVRFEIKALQKQHQLTSIYVTHDQAEALAMSDRIIVLNQGRIEQIGTPEEIYYQPESCFVARFVGAANITTAKVSPVSPNLYQVETGMGTFIIRSRTRPDDHHIHVCWRPEDARPATESAQNLFHARIHSWVFQGNYIDVFAGVGKDFQETVRLQLQGRQPLTEGQIIPLALPETSIHFLEAVS